MNVTSLLVAFLDFLAEKTHYHHICINIPKLIFTFTTLAYCGTCTSEMWLYRPRPTLWNCSLGVSLTSFQAIFTGQKTMDALSTMRVLVHVPVTRHEVLSVQLRRKKRFCSHPDQGQPSASSLPPHILHLLIGLADCALLSGKPSPIQRDVTLLSGPNRTTI